MHSYITFLPMWLRALLVCLTGLILAKFFSMFAIQQRLRKVMPPGPPGWPLLGNIFQLPRAQWLHFTELRAQYGPIFSLQLLGQPVVVINDLTIAADLLDRRSAIYSERPRFIMAGDILTGGLFFALKSGDRWQRMRRAAHEGFSGRAAVAYQPLQEKQALHLIFHMLQDPDSWEEHFNRTAASSVLSIVYGWQPLDGSRDFIVKKINDITFDVASALLQGAHFVEFFPWMLHLPDWMAKWKREGRARFQSTTELFRELVGEVSDRMNMGEIDADTCFAAKLIAGDFSLDALETVWLAGSMFGAGAESTAVTFITFILAMTLYPEVMRRAQAQIDAVVGRSRLPTFGDRDHLPYIEAIVKEVLRWKPVFPLAAPRYTTQDDYYKGYFIPKNTLIIYNIWGINKDPAYFPDFDEFRPERFLDLNGNLAEPIPDTHGQGHLAFGAGRRICVGKDFAGSSLFINIAAMLWAFNIEKARDSNGKLIVPSRSDCADEGIVLRPAPFKCAISPRTADIAAYVGSAMDGTVH